MNELDQLAAYRDVAPPSQETMREVATLFQAETELLPPHKRLGTRQLAMAGGGVAAAAAVFGVVSLIGAITSPAPQAADNPNPRDLMLAAFDQNANSIMHVVSSLRTGDGTPFGTDEWFSSVQPNPGETVVHRGIVGAGKVRQDWSETYVVPTPGPLPGNCQISGLPSNRVGQELAVDGDTVTVDYGAKAWATTKDTCLLTGEQRPQQIREEIASGQWQRVPGETTVDGQRAIEYTQESDGRSGNIYRALWVEADSYLPIKSTLKATSPDGKTVVHTETDEFTFLPDTQANRANLTVPIPSGFRQVPSLPERSAPPAH